MHRTVLILLSLLLIAEPSLAMASDPVKNFQVAARTLGFVENSNANVRIAVLFNPASPQSVADKDAILVRIGDGFRMGQVMLTGIALSINDLSGARDIDAIYIVSGMSAHYQVIKQVADRLKVVTIGADMDCVQSNLCAVGAETEPRVQVYISRSASIAANVSFQDAFLMLAKEL